jgi:DNA-binding NarL/FixJ family response regulator
LICRVGRPKLGVSAGNLDRHGLGDRVAGVLPRAFRAPALSRNEVARMSRFAGSRSRPASHISALHTCRARHEDRGGASEHCDVGAVTLVLAALDPVVALGVGMLLRNEPRPCLLDCGSGDAALEAALMRCEPHAAVLGERTEPATVERLRSIRPQTGVLVLAHAPAHDDGMRLLAAGANCVPRGAQDLELVDAIYRTVDGERFFVAADGGRVERRYPPGAEPLTNREYEILVYLARGASYSTIAVELRISVRTAEKHASSIFQKLRVRGKRELIGMPLPPEHTGSTHAASCGH